MTKNAENEKYLNLKDDFLRIYNIRHIGNFYPGGPKKVEQVTGQKFSGDWPQVYTLLVKNNFGSTIELEENLKSPQCEGFVLSLAVIRQIDEKKLPIFLPESAYTREFVRRLYITKAPDIFEIIFFNYAFKSLIDTSKIDQSPDFEIVFSTDNPLQILKNISRSIEPHQDNLATQLIRLIGIYVRSYPTLRSAMLEAVNASGSHKFFRKLGKK